MSPRSLNAIAWRQTNLEFYDLVPYGVGALVVGNGQKLPQPATRVRKLRFVAYGLWSGLLVGRWRGFEGRLLDGLFFVHMDIIA
ncbi:MAG: hypothetical protein NTV11_04235 [Rhodocyclales bacterium]|nr:hypothetical protein [Rhodocyclales bacterium]